MDFQNQSLKYYYACLVIYSIAELEEKMSITKVTRNYQVTIPRDVREIIDINIGDDILVNVDDGEIRLKKLSYETAVEKAFGTWADIKEDSVSYVRKMRAESERRMKRLGL